MHWKQLLRSVQAYAWLVLAMIAASLPGHYGHALNEAKFGESLWQVVLASVASDVHLGYWIIGFASLGLAFLPRKRHHVAWATGIMTVLFLAIWVFVLLAVEFRIQRGIYPTWFDITTAKGDAGFLTSSVGILWLDRYLLANIVGALLGAFALTMFARDLKRCVDPSSSEQVPFVIHAPAAVLTMALASFCGFHLFVSTKYLGGLTDKSEYISPIERFIKGTPVRGGAANGIRMGTETTRASWTEIVSGARMLGWDGIPAIQPATQEGACVQHPLKESFSVARPDVLLGSDLEQGIDRVAKALVFSEEKPLIVWHVMLESVRADEITALNKDAEPGVTPWINSLHALARSSGTTTGSDLVIASPRMWGSGARSSQSLAGMVCGAGTMPFTFSAARDFGYLALRCLPDVLKDAGFTTRVYFGASLKFDEKRTFYRQHGIETREREDVPPGLTRGSWGITDRALAQWVSDDISRDQSATPRPMHILVTTVTNHPPFDAPSDTPDELKERLRELSLRRGIDPDDAKRLVTTAYTDFAVQELSERVRALGLADRSLFVLAGDHSVGTPPLWAPTASRKSNNFRRAAFHIPFLIVLPKELVARVRAPHELADAVTRMNAILNDNDLSQNDEPRMILRLLAGSGFLNALPEAWRWHTLGGQRYASKAEFTPVPEARVWGTDALARLTLINPTGEIMPLNDRSGPPPQGTKDLRAAARKLAPMISVLGYLMREGGQCPIRAVE